MNIKVGDKVKNKFPPHEEGIVITIHEYSDNPYSVMVQLSDKVGNFKLDHLEVLTKQEDNN